MKAAERRQQIAELPVDAPWHLLTAREREVLDRIVGGESMAAIARDFSIRREGVRRLHLRALAVLNGRFPYKRRVWQYEHDREGLGLNRGPLHL